MESRLPLHLRAMQTGCRLALTVACAALSSAALPAGEQDVVTLRAAPGGGAPRSISGQIVDYTGRELRIRLATGRERSIPPADIERIETERCAEQSAADQLFADGDFRLAEAKYRAAIETDREVRPGSVAKSSRSSFAATRTRDSGSRPAKSF